MITRRDTLLVRPWQQRQYNQHRFKVLSALPAVDVAPPPLREHVLVNLKHVQREKERCEKIDLDNYRLVQRLAGVMRTSRVDNRWQQPQPTFLNRVGIYHTSRAQSAPCRLCPHQNPRWRSEQDEYTSIDTEESSTDGSSAPRNSTCLACHPQTARRKLHERSSGRSREAEQPDRQQEQPVVTPTSSHDEALEEQSASAERLPDEQVKDGRQMEIGPKARRRGRRRGKSAPPPASLHQLVVTYDALRLAVNFPAHASILLPSGRTMQCTCPCPRLPPVTTRMPSAIAH